MAIRFFFTESYNRTLESLEDFILESTGEISQVEAFLKEHDRVLTFIEHNPRTPAIHPVTGDQSWVFGEGRYRVFFVSTLSTPGEGTGFLTHIIDNRQVNLAVCPENSLPTYLDDEE